MTINRPPASRWQTIRLALWMLAGIAMIGALILAAAERSQQSPAVAAEAPQAAPFTLIDASGKEFASSALAGKPYALFFGFTRCGDVCPTTLGRLAALRKQAGGNDAFAIVFVTIDPANDGPAEVGQYAAMFGTPIIGLTGSPEAIAQVKRQYGIFAEPNPHSTGHGDMISHTSAVLLFDRDGRRAGTITASDSNSAAHAKLLALSL